MRNLKKILALALALVMTLSLVTVANAFTDSKDINGTYTEAVEVLSGMGVFKGYEDGSFQPQGDITRAEVAAIIYRIVTGDVTDKQVGIYADYNKFDDVKSTSWYAGYVNYCANAGYIKGYGDGNFGPNDKVTGYQALAMILRAVGYDRNQEWTGEGWEIKVASTANQLDVTKNVTSSTLGNAASRQVVAEILFRAIQVPQVNYLTNTMSYVPLTVNENGLVVTLSLGTQVFGLEKYNGYVIGNQATGESKTVIGNFTTTTIATVETPVVATTATLTYTSGLDQFGHNVSGWFCGKVGVRGAAYGDVFTLNDNGSSATITKPELQAKTGLDIVALSDSYGVVERTNATNPVDWAWDYNVLVTNPGVGNDVLIRLYLDIAQYRAINNYTTNPYLTVFSGYEQKDVNIALAYATGYQNVTLGSYINVLLVNGTAGASDKVFPQKQISALGGYTNVTVTYIDKDGTATLSNGAVVKSSSGTHKQYAANVDSRLDITRGLKFKTNYNVYTDLFGNYVGAIELTSESYAKLTYAYYETVPSTGEITYYGQIVRNDGSIEVVKLDVDAVGYNALNCAKLDLGNNIGTDGGNAVTDPKNYVDLILDGGKIITSEPIAIADLNEVGLTTVGELNRTDWTINKSTNTITNAKNYFVDASTKFVVVSGWGGKLSVTTYNGVSELLGGNVSAVVPADSIVTAHQVYTANITSQNYHVDYVLIEKVTYTAPTDLIYIEDGAYVTEDGTNYYYWAYINGESLLAAVPKGDVVASQTFYKYELKGTVYDITGLAQLGVDCYENYVLNNSLGVEYLYVLDANGKQLKATDDTKIINLTGVEGVPTTAAELMDAAENSTITVDVEVSGTTILNVYIVGYANADKVVEPALYPGAEK